jgi:hypothetical protein
MHRERDMNAMKKLLRAVALAVALLGAAGWSGAARADAFTDLVWIVQQLEATGASPFPVKSNEIQAAKGLFDCLQKDSSATGVAGCVHKFSQTPEGKQMLGVDTTIKLPPWLTQLVSAYVNVKEGDFWGLVSDLGEAALCIAAQVMAMGIDVCGLIQDLIALGEALLDAGKAVVKFFASVGGTTYEIAKSVGCGLGLGGCSSKTPPEVAAYKCVFAPVVSTEGLKAREAVDPFAYPKLRAALVAAAVSGTICFGTKQQFGHDAAEKAAKVFDNAVDGTWTSHLVQNVLLQREKKRAEYATAGQAVAVAQAAAAAYDQNKEGLAKPDPGKWVRDWIVKRCAADDFGDKYGFAHVDRWLDWRKPGQTENQINALKVPNVTSNAQWCVVEFLNKHRDQFAAQFVDFAKGKYCPMFSSAMACGDIAKYEACTGLLSSVGKADLCGANAASIGKEIAKKIDAYFTAQKSQFACQTVLPDGATPVSTKPVQYVCARPTQQHYCKQKYHELWTGKAEVLSCAKQLSTAYVLQMTLVDKEVAALKAKYVAVGIDKIDPLMVHVGTPQIFAALKQEHDKSGGKLGTGSVAFELSVVTPQTIDGVLQPAIVGDLKGVAPLSQPVASGALAGRTALVKPGDPDPAFKPSLEAAAGGLSAGAAAAQGTASSQQQKVLSGPAPTGPGVGRSVEPAAAAAQASPTLTNPQDAYKGERGLPKEEPGRTSSPPPGVQSPPTTAAGSTALPTARTQLPAVQTPPPQARLPSMQAPATANTVSTPPPTRSQLPAVQAPSPQSQLPAGQPAAPGAGRTAAPGAAPNWSALGAAPGSSPPMTAARVGAPSMTANSTAPASDAIARELAAAGCSAGPGGSRFACATRAGFDRCEALRRERRVEQCALSERR